MEKYGLALKVWKLRNKINIKAKENIPFENVDFKNVIRTLALRGHKKIDN